MKRYFKYIIYLLAFALIVVFAFIPFITPERRGGFVIPPTAESADFGISLPYGSAKSAIVIDAETLSIVSSHGCDEVRGMASTTKIMTALIALECCDLDSEHAIPREAVGIEGSSVYLLEGERLTVRELLYCLLLESGNDAATALAIIASGSTQAFCDRMNAKAEALGLIQTHFDNPHGLSSEGHRTTAYELALITAEAMKNPTFREIVATKSIRVRYGGVKNGRLLTNHNKLLKEFEGAVGVKTGYTEKDGRCLVSAAERDGVRLICVTLNDNSPRETHRNMLESAFASLERVRVLERGEIEAVLTMYGSESELITLTNTEYAELTLPKGSKTEVRLFLPSGVDAPVERGEEIGYAAIYYGERLVYIIPLVATDTAEVKKESIIDKLR